MIKRQSYRLTGTPNSLRSALVWKSDTTSTLSKPRGQLKLYTRRSQMGNTSKPHLAELDGRCWLVSWLPCKITVIKKVQRFPEGKNRFLGNHEEDCLSIDSIIGLSVWGYPDEQNSCGSLASHGGDNGSKRITAMGYTLHHNKIRSFTCDGHS